VLVGLVPNIVVEVLGSSVTTRTGTSLFRRQSWSARKVRNAAAYLMPPREEGNAGRQSELGFVPEHLHHRWWKPKVRSLEHPPKISNT
jgi:hypothetical protein